MEDNKNLESNDTEYSEDDAYSDCVLIPNHITIGDDILVFGTSKFFMTKRKEIMPGVSQNGPVQL